MASTLGKILAGCCLLTAFMASAKAGISASIGMLTLPTLLSAPCEAVENLREIDVYDSPDGLRIGKLTLDRLDWAKTAEPGCSALPQLVFQVEGQDTQNAVLLSEHARELPAMAVYREESRKSGVWVEGRHRWGGFWVNATQAGHYYSLYRDLVQGISRLSETCDDHGRCQPAPPEWDKLLRQANAIRQQRGDAGAYEILGIERLDNGRLAYVVKLAAGLRQFEERGLPRFARIPILDYRGHWTGYFSAHRADLK